MDDLLARARRILIKVGSAVLAGDDGLRPDVFRRLAEGLLALADRGVEVVVVSSGAIAAGRAKLGLPAARTLPELQAAAAVGQAELIRAWETALAPKAVAQILLDASDLADRKRYLNARNTIERLLAWGWCRSSTRTTRS